MQDRMFLAALTGFREPDTESAFLRFHHRRSELRAVFITCGAVLSVYGILDLALFSRAASHYVMALLAFNLLVFSGLMAATYSPHFEKISSMLVAGMALAAAWGVSALEYAGIGDSRMPLHFHGTALVMIGFFGLGKLPVLQSFLTGLGMILPAIAVDSLRGAPDPQETLSRTSFLLTIIIIGSFSTGLIQFAARRGFLAQREIEGLTITDSLTGLRNRRYFYSVVQPELQRFARQFTRNGQKLSRRATDSADDSGHYLVLIDVDGFTAINDQFGHDAGDGVLAEIGARIQALIRTSDVAVRWGGEEFLVILKNTTDEYARRFPDLLRNALITSPMRLASKEVHIGMSGGGVRIPRGASSSSDVVEHFIGKAQHALIHSKTSGKNRFTDFTELENGPFGAKYRQVV